jgi:hypothetical protein
MKLTIQFSDRPPLVVDDAWRLVIENKGESFEIIPQMVDRGELRMLLRVNDIASRLAIIPHGSNSIVFGAKK